MSQRFTDHVAPKLKDGFEWNDELVIKWGDWVQTAVHLATTGKYLIDWGKEFNKFKQAHQLSTSKEVFTWDENKAIELIKFIQGYPNNGWPPKEKIIEQFKQSHQSSIPDNSKERVGIISTSPNLFTQEYVDKVREDAFNAANETEIIKSVDTKCEYCGSGEDAKISDDAPTIIDIGALEGITLGKDGKEMTVSELIDLMFKEGSIVFPSGKRYSQQQMDKARQDAFYSARRFERDSDLIRNNLPNMKYPTLQSYLQSLKSKP